MYGILLVFHVLIAILLISLILIQHGKGAQAGAAFGSGASQTVFGSQGSGGFLTRTTWILAAIFFITSIVLAYLINRQTHRIVAPVQLESREGSAPAQPVGEELPEVP